MSNLENLNKYLQKISEYNYIVTILRWEMDTVAPKKSFDYLINVSTKYELESFKLLTNDEYIKLLENLINSDELKSLNDMQKTYLLSLQDDFYKFKNVPEKFYSEYCELKNRSLNSWVEAKEKADYLIFKPYLKDIIMYTKQFYKYMYPDTNNLYDCMLNDYESGIKSELIDKLFGELKEKIIPIISQLKENKINTVENKYSDSELLEIAKFILEYIGFDNSRGALGIYTHGYTMKLNNNDTRITFSNEDNIIDYLSTVVHEGGHGIFEQNISEDLANFPIYDINKIALHESQSRFFENILGRNSNFWYPIFDDIKKLLKVDISLEDFLNQFNNAKTSLIRIEADELTYCMHIIIRYEIEKEIFNNDNIDLDKLPEMWNRKYKQYLGLDVPNDREGILQDMHWSEGAFGYFPSYLLGSIFDGMLLEKINTDLGDVNEILKSGKIKEITKFLNENIHKYGATYNINQVSNRVCGKDLEVEPLVKYFENKYMK